MENLLLSSVNQETALFQRNVRAAGTLDCSHASSSFSWYGSYWLKTYELRTKWSGERHSEGSRTCHKNSFLFIKADVVADNATQYRSPSWCRHLRQQVLWQMWDRVNIVSQYPQFNDMCPVCLTVQWHVPCLSHSSMTCALFVSQFILWQNGKSQGNLDRIPVGARF